MDFPVELKNFLDKEGLLKQWPTKKTMQDIALNHMFTKFSPDRKYSEPEVNQVLRQCHTFENPALLRRAMVDAKLLQRTKDGREYWVEKKEEPAQA
ncbi:MAG: DUF2087 domain-containing protein [Candidatus Wallbacteria bacterium]|nr:DUF2087 domain-containing protein [Candidatus Wallbacteria bacterium]